ncbi:uncharacterized protein LOC129601324, partial [Paramacrobiotus metropolitanus]|uniref:uncharacterized protein LOC129601324 n=1 Tax=Paramacrobiotus metropolitanus TaxID=2943436 RepID=UPI00244628EB
MCPRIDFVRQYISKRTVWIQIPAMCLLPQWNLHSQKDAKLRRAIFVSAVLLYCGNHIAGKNATSLNIVLLTVINNGSTTEFGFRSSAAVMDYGVDALQTTYGEFGNFSHAISIPGGETPGTSCSNLEARGPFFASKFFYEQGGKGSTLVFLGPGCGGAVASLGHLARAWNVPFFTNLGIDTALGLQDKKRFPTLIRLSPYQNHQAVDLMLVILKYFHWTNVSCLCDDSLESGVFPSYYISCRYMFDTLRLKNVNAWRTAFNPQANFSAADLDDKLKEIQRNSRDDGPKATFWATRYFYRQAVGNPVMGLFGPGCPTAAASVGHLARAWNKQMLIAVAGDAAVSAKTRYPTLTRLSPYIQEDLTKFVVEILKAFKFTTVGVLCDDANDAQLYIYVPMCTGIFDDLRLRHNISANRYYVNGSDLASTNRYLEEVRSQAR